MTEAWLPDDLSVQAFDDLHDDLPAWRAAIASLSEALGSRSVEQFSLSRHLLS